MSSKRPSAVTPAPIWHHVDAPLPESLLNVDYGSRVGKVRYHGVLENPLTFLSCKDAICFVEFLQNGLWGFAACQGTIFIVSSILQFRNAGCKKIARLTLESWSMGLPCNELQRILVEEKTFEAPLSLFIQSPGAKRYSLVFQGCFLASEDSPTYTPQHCLLNIIFRKILHLKLLAIRTCSCYSVMTIQPVLTFAPPFQGIFRLSGLPEMTRRFSSCGFPSS